MPTVTNPPPAAGTNKAVRYAAAAPLATAKVDAATGILRDVAIMSVGDAAGHDCVVDLATLTKLFELTQGKTVKAFVNHDWCPSPTEVVGVFSGLYIDAPAGVLRAAQFQALKSFREHNTKAFDTLFELAQIAPDSFGVSVSIYQELAWKKADGTEILTDGWAPRPDDAVGEGPFIRPTFIESADFVSSPAANKALFSSKHTETETQSQKEIDATALSAQARKQQIETESQLAASKQKSTLTMKALYQKFKDNPKALTRAMQLAAEAPADAPKSDEVIIAEVEDEIDEEAAKALAAENADLKAKLAAAEAKVAELEPKAAESAALSTKVTDLQKQVAQFTSRRGRFGAAPVAAGLPENKEAPTITRAAFNALDHAARNAHMAAGGKLTD